MTIDWQNYAATGGRDGRWALHDVVKTHDAPLQTVDSGAPLSVVQFHVDGLLLATGDSVCVVFVKLHFEQKKLIRFTFSWEVLDCTMCCRNNVHCRLTRIKAASLPLLSLKMVTILSQVISFFKKKNSPK